MDAVADLSLALDAARAAGEAVMRYFGRSLEVHLKAADQPVTDADLEADAILRSRLLAARPGYGWLSEESVDDRSRLRARRVWIVDPIDGTNSFIAGRPEFVISIGLVEAGRPLLGVALNPATGECYHALAGGGAYLNDAPIRVRGDDAPVMLLASRSEVESGAVAKFAAGWELRGLGSTAYRMLKVAAGEAHLYATASAKSEWDLCAAALLVAEAGGSVGDAAGGELRFNQRVPRASGVVAAATPPLFAEAVRRLAAPAAR